MSTKSKNVVALIAKTICAFVICYFLQMLLTSDYTTQPEQQYSSDDIKVESSVGKEKSYFMEYLQDLPDSGVTKVMYKYMDNIDTSDTTEVVTHNDFIYAYSFVTDAPCVGVEAIIQEDVYNTSALKVEVHTLNKVKACIVEEDDYIMKPTSTPTPTPLQKIYKNENVSAETQYDARYLAEKYDVPLEILLGIAYKETRYTTGVISKDRHDYGFCQIRDVNHDWLEKEIGRKLDFLNSEYDSMEAACFMLRNLKNKYNTSSWGFILLCYNGGEEYANKLASQGIWGSSYTQDVLSKAYSLGWDGD